jgi:hypothetical protein
VAEVTPEAGVKGTAMAGIMEAARGTEAGTVMAPGRMTEGTGITITVTATEITMATQAMGLGKTQGTGMARIRIRCNSLHC